MAATTTLTTSQWFPTAALPIVNDFSVATRNRTLFLAHLNLAAYPSCAEGAEHNHHCSYPDETLQELWTRNESLYGPDIVNSSLETNSADQFHQENWRLLMSYPNLVEYQEHSLPQETAEFVVGIQALEYTTKDALILVFRGTYSPGDYANIENWMMDYLIEKSTERMKSAWIKDAQLNWTDTMEARTSEANDDKWIKLEIRAAEFVKRNKYAQILADSVSRNKTLSEAIDGGGLTLDDVHSTGYWKLTKYLVDYAYQKAKGDNKKLILTGHSQGGTRAQLASMYLNGKYGVETITETFAATGSACAARHLFHHNSDLLLDVDPYADHSSHIMDVVHPLDPWGNSMLGMDNGRVCHWGMPLLKADENNNNNNNPISENALEYCSRIYGYSGPTLIAAQEDAPLTGLLDRDTTATELKHNFQRCRYYTHTAEGILLGLYADFLDSASRSDNNNPTICNEVPVIPVDDPNGQCPTGNIPKDEQQAMIVIVVVVVFAIVGVVLGLCCCLCCRNGRKQQQLYSNNLLSGMDESEVFATTRTSSDEQPFRDEPHNNDDDEDVDENGIELL